MVYYTGKEILNDFLHVLAGFFLSYLLIPTSKWWILILFVLAFAAVREHIQNLRGHTQRGFHLYTDCIGFLLGAIVFVGLRRYLPHTNTRK